MIDTHAHLDGCSDPSDVLVARARQAGVRRIVTVGSGIESCRAALAMADQHDGVFAALGIHPHQAGGDEAEQLAELDRLLEHPRAVAVGETGLDYFRDYAPREAQLRVFERQLELATDRRKAVVVHTRDAAADTARALEGFAGTVVLHCFSSPELLEPALEHEWFVSFAGNVTYPKANDLRAAAARVPSDRLLAETDSPYLAPQPVRGRENEPANVVHTVAALASARGEDPAELGERIEQNATAAFALP
ncbi:MAG: TatD family hydrolase [Actinomycetota bacterium]|nr:TatD family hydrolase [Actinomycetota bacterium]